MIDIVLLVVALICFILRAINISLGSVNLLAAGLAFWVATALL